MTSALRATVALSLLSASAPALAPALLAQSDSYLYGSGRQRAYSAGASSYAKSAPRQQRSWYSRASSYRASRSWYDKRGIYRRNR